MVVDTTRGVVDCFHITLYFNGVARVNEHATKKIFLVKSAK